jgi:preprotein translocase subunit SecA
MVRMALSALHLFHRDEAYVVQEGKVQIVDEFTGRVMADRSYERGLHQLIEAKEGVELTRRPETRARISYQRFFRRYLHLGGMTGTAREVRGELWNVYRLPVVRIPTHRPRQREALPERIFRTDAEKWRAVAQRVEALHGEGRPVLVGTRSVAASELASRMLSEKGVPHQVLNAKQDREEAEIVARAGEAGCVTIATNMAGRGTDIKLAEGVKGRGGLHVILTERHEAARIDRQLAGRCGRLGDPGSYEALLSMEDPILQGGRGGVSGRVSARLARVRSPAWKRMASRSVRRAQKRVEKHHARLRKALLKEDERRGNLLSFSGGQE